MKRPFLLILLLLTFLPLRLQAQEQIDLSPEDIERISKRWAKYHPEADVLLKNGDSLSGQPIHFNMQELFLYPSDSLPLSLEGNLLVLPFDSLKTVWLKRGGPVTPGLATGIIVGIGVGMGIGAVLGSPGAMLILGNVGGGLGGVLGKAGHRSSNSSELELISYKTKYPDELKKLHDWSVFEDTLVYLSDINELTEYSASMRRLYPQKHFRITLGINGGIQSIKSDMQEAIFSSGLPPMEDYISSALGFEYLDFSWRFSYHWILGFGMMSNNNNLAWAYYYGDYYPEGPFENYTYTVNLNDFRFYMEYAFSPVNRFLSERTELLLGGGLIVSRPRTYFSYSYQEDIDAENYWFDDNSTHSLMGFQVRAAGHVYLFRNFSLSGGVELNLYQDLNMPAFMPPEGSQQSQPILDAHSLNYSAVRFKLGAHLYF